MKAFIRSVYAATTRGVHRSIYMIMCRLPFTFYQPVYGRTPGRGRLSEGNVTRACRDRWSHITDTIDPGTSILDIGCNIGFFSFSAAEKGCMAFGVDYDPLYITACRAIAEATESTRTVFVERPIDETFIAAMPSFDVVFNFSVFHHWVKLYGEDKSKDMMRALAGKCSAMYFETGQANEVGTNWRGLLAFMGDDPEAWIESFLREIGFKEVKLLGHFPTGLTATDRALFHATK